jgi:hypothetical protein
MYVWQNYYLTSHKSITILYMHVVQPTCNPKLHIFLTITCNLLSIVTWCHHYFFIMITPIIFLSWLHLLTPIMITSTLHYSCAKWSTCIGQISLPHFQPSYINPLHLTNFSHLTPLHLILLRSIFSLSISKSYSLNFHFSFNSHLPLFSFFVLSLSLQKRICILINSIIFLVFCIGLNF